MCLLRVRDWVFICFVWIWEQKAIISLYCINWLVFITETEHLQPAHRTPSPKPRSNKPYDSSPPAKSFISHNPASSLVQFFFIYGSKKHCFTSATWHNSNIYLKCNILRDLVTGNESCIAVMLVCLHEESVEQRPRRNRYRLDWTAHSESNIQRRLDCTQRV
jgi:hypothetical protein